MDHSLQKKKNLGQYFTPEPVVAAAFEILDSLSGRNRDRKVSVIDPACGDGAFLRYAIKMRIAKQSATLGIDCDYRFDSSANSRRRKLSSFQILNQNGLLAFSDESKGFDYVVGNPPYGTKLLNGTETEVEEELLKRAIKDNFAIWRNGNTLATKEYEKEYLTALRSCPIEVLFLERFVQLACGSKRPAFIAIVIPDGVLANSRLLHARKWLTERLTINCILSLPRVTFTGVGTTAKTSLLVMNTGKAATDHKTFLARVEDLERDLPIIIAAWNKYRSKNRTRSNHKSISLIKQSNSEFTGRMDAGYWSPQWVRLMETLRATFPTTRLCDVGRAIIGDHVRKSRGEEKGYNLNSPIEYYETKGFTETGYDTARIKRCSENAFKRLGYTAVRQNDILISCAGVGGVGQARVCFINHRPGLSCTGDVFILRLPSSQAGFVYLFLKSKFGRAQITRLSNGTGTLNINSEELLSLEIPVLENSSREMLVSELKTVSKVHHTAMKHRADTRSENNSYLKTMREAAELQQRLVHNLEQFLDNKKAR